MRALRRDNSEMRPAVFLRDFPGSFKIPGSDAAFKIGGLVRVNWVTTLDPLLVDDRFLTADIPVDVDPEAEPDTIDFEALNAIVRFRQPTNTGGPAACIRR